VNPAQRLAAATYQPEIDMECDVCGSRCAAAAELGKCSGPYMLVEDEPGNVLQVGALLGGRPVDDGLQLHGHGARLGDQRADLDVGSAQVRHFDGDLNGAVTGPGMGEGMQAAARIAARPVDLGPPDLEHVGLDLAKGCWQQYRGRLDRLRTSRSAENLKLGHFAEQPADDIDIGGGTVGTGEAPRSAVARRRVT
jgi:hypothetical protein